MFTKAANQRCIKLSKVVWCIIVTTHLEQRDDNITQVKPYDGRIHQKINHRIYKQRNWCTNRAIEGRHEVIYKANRKKTIIINSTKYYSRSQLSQPTTYERELCDYPIWHSTIDLSFLQKLLVSLTCWRWIYFACILYTPALSLQKLYAPW